jgi:phospholipid/cholesterol/gamma-HCH transport system ATP-binding protein
LKIHDLSFKRDEKIIFDQLNFRFSRGSITAILGPSGTGKTTLLRFIGGEIESKPGHVFVDGIDVGTLSLKELYVLRHKMGMLFQEDALFTDLNVFDNVAFPLRELTQLPESMISDLVLMKLEAVGLRGAHHLNIDELSGGMAHRAALARGVVLDPALMMYDEPLTGLDPVTRGIVMRLIKQFNDSMNFDFDCGVA